MEQQLMLKAMDCLLLQLVFPVSMNLVTLNGKKMPLVSELLQQKVLQEVMVL